MYNLAMIPVGEGAGITKSLKQMAQAFGCSYSVQRCIGQADAADGIWRGGF